jgi:hypothetical protein
MPTTTPHAIGNGREEMATGRIMRTKGTARIYRIVLGSGLGDREAPAFEVMRMERREGRTIITGEVKDMPYLFGILQRTNGLGLQLLSVETLSEEDVGGGPSERR